MWGQSLPTQSINWHIPSIHPPRLVFLQISLHLSAFVCRQLSSEDLARVPANSTSNILNRLLVTYDPRIRPNFKGKSLSLASLFLLLIDIFAACKFGNI